MQTTKDWRSHIKEGGVDEFDCKDVIYMQKFQRVYKSDLQESEAGLIVRLSVELAVADQFLKLSYVEPKTPRPKIFWSLTTLTQRMVTSAVIELEIVTTSQN